MCLDLGSRQPRLPQLLARVELELVIAVWRVGLRRVPIGEQNASPDRIRELHSRDVSVAARGDEQTVSRRSVERRTKDPPRIARAIAG